MEAVPVAVPPACAVLPLGDLTPDEAFDRVDRWFVKNVLGTNASRIVRVGTCADTGRPYMHVERLDRADVLVRAYANDGEISVHPSIGNDFSAVCDLEARFGIGRWAECDREEVKLGIVPPKCPACACSAILPEWLTRVAAR